MDIPLRQFSQKLEKIENVSFYSACLLLKENCENLQYVDEDLERECQQTF